MAEKLLSVIIPYRVAKSRTYLFERLARNAREFGHESIEFIFVDSASTWRAEELRDMIGARHKYVWHDTRNMVFAAGKARDYGAQHATAPVLLFLDADVNVDKDFFERVLTLVKVKNIRKELNSFFCVPGITLSEAGSKKLEKIPVNEWRFKLLEDIFSGQNEYGAQLQIATSQLVINRHKYLAMGGHRPEFYGHGYEDFDLIHRLIASSNTVPVRPTNYYTDTHSPSTADNFRYDGFRAMFTLIGREAMYNGLYVYHLFHPRVERVEHREQLAINRENAINYFKEYDASGQGPYPLEDLSSSGRKTLLLDMPYNLFANSLKDVVPYLGRVSNRETKFFYNDGKFSAEKLEKYLINNDVDMVAFSNPYGHEDRLAIYRHLRQIKFPVMCYDRGALPDSWFFDVGFNQDSPSYAEELWNRELSPAEREEINAYFDEVITGNNYLEYQKERIGPAAMRRKLGLENRKILFAPLQKQADTVIKYFIGNAGSYERYLEELSILAREIDAYDWVVVCKKHPLDENVKVPDNLILVPDNSNIMDLLVMADAVTVINSGTGLLAAICEKPCYIWGDAFYQNDKINKSVASWQEVHDDILKGPFKVDMEHVERFVHYLKNNLYSFGKSQYRYAFGKDNSVFKVTTGMDLQQIRLPFLSLDFAINPDNRFLPDGFAYELFREDIGQRFKNWRKDLEKNQIGASDPPPGAKKKKSESGAKKSRSDASSAKASVPSSATPQGSIPLFHSSLQLLNDLNAASVPTQADKKTAFLKKLFNRKIKTENTLKYGDMQRLLQILASKGFTEANRMLESFNLAPQVKADAYTAMARAMLKSDKKRAADLAYLAWKCHPRHYRQKWLAYRLYEAGDVDSAALLIQFLPEDTPMTEKDRKHINKIMVQSKV